MPVTIEAPFHGEGLFLPGERHAVDSSVTRDAPDSFLHVDRMMEVDKVGQVVNAAPRPRVCCRPG